MTVAERLKRRLIKLLNDCAEAHYWPQLEIGKPAAHRQTIVAKDVYLKPHDRSDELTCSCCAQKYEDRFRSRLRPIVTNWCRGCRELLHEMTVEEALALHVKDRKGLTRDIKSSERAVEEAYARTGAKPVPRGVETT